MVHLSFLANLAFPFLSPNLDTCSVDSRSGDYPSILTRSSNTRSIIYHFLSVSNFLRLTVTIRFLRSVKVLGVSRMLKCLVLYSFQRIVMCISLFFSNNFPIFNFIGHTCLRSQKKFTLFKDVCWLNLQRDKLHFLSSSFIYYFFLSSFIFFESL